MCHNFKNKWQLPKKWKYTNYIQSKVKTFAQFEQNTKM